MCVTFELILFLVFEFFNAYAQVRVKLIFINIILWKNAIRIKVGNENTNVFLFYFEILDLQTLELNSVRDVVLISSFYSWLLAPYKVWKRSTKFLYNFIAKVHKNKFKVLLVDQHEIYQFHEQSPKSASIFSCANLMLLYFQLMR